MVDSEHRRDLLDGIPLYKPILGGIRHLAVDVYRRPNETRAALLLWCTAVLHPSANPARTYNWDCKYCYENYQEAQHVPRSRRTRTRDERR